MCTYIDSKIPKKIKVYIEVAIEVVSRLHSIEYTDKQLENTLRQVVHDIAEKQGTKVQAVRDKLYRQTSCGTDRKAYLAILDMLLQNNEDGFNELQKIALTVKSSKTRAEVYKYIDRNICDIRLLINKHQQ